MKVQLENKYVIAMNDGQSVADLDPLIAPVVGKHPMFDADAGIFFQRQIEYIEERIYSELYRPLEFRDYIPIHKGASEGADTFTFRWYEKKGRAKLGTAAGSDLPRADLEAKEHRFKIESVVSSYAYNVTEIAAAMDAKISLDAMKAEACARAIEEELNRLAWHGDEDANMPGLFTNTDINQTASPQTWLNMTPEQILTQINNAFGTIFQNSFKNHKANCVLLPIDRWNYIMTTRSSSTAATNMTIAQYLVQNSPFLTSLDDLKPVNACSSFAGFDAADSRVMVVYQNDPMNLQFVLPMEMKFYTIQEHNLEFKIPALARAVGTIVRYPRSIEFVTNI